MLGIPSCVYMYAILSIKIQILILLIEFLDYPKQIMILKSFYSMLFKKKHQATLLSTISLRTKRKETTALLNELEDTFSSARMNSPYC